MALAPTYETQYLGLRSILETTRGTKPSSGNAYIEDVIGYGQVGSTYTSTQHNPYSRDRMNRHGKTTRENAQVNFTTDIAYFNFLRLIQGFLYTVGPRERPTTAPLNGARIAVSGLSTSAATIGSAIRGMAADDIVALRGFQHATNNSARVLSGTPGTTLTLNKLVNSDPNLIAERSPPTAARIDVVGKRISLAVATTGGLTTLTGSAIPVLYPGEEVFITGINGAENVFARVVSHSATSVVIDNPSKTIPATVAAGSRDLYFGDYVANETYASNRQLNRTYSFEASIADDENDSAKKYKHIIQGATPGSATITMPTEGHLTAEYSYMGYDTVYADTAETWTDIAIPDNNVYLDNGDSCLQQWLHKNGTQFIDWIESGSINIDNQLQPNYAQSRTGAIGMSKDYLMVGGSFTPYYRDNILHTSLAAHDRVGFTAIYAERNRGLVFDIPVVGMGNGALATDKGGAITISTDLMGSRSQFHQLIGITEFKWLPSSAY